MDKDQAYTRNLEQFSKKILKQARQALSDDVGAGDITSKSIIQNKLRVEDAVIIAKAHGVLCGLLEAKALFEEGGLEFRNEKNEGDLIRSGDIIARVRGNIEELLKRERTALNYLQVLSGIATTTIKLTRRYPQNIASLRKTHPGLCFSEKRAVQVGGGFTHRLGLYDGFLIKDNHLAAVVKEIFGDSPITQEKKIAAIRESLKRVKKYRVNTQLNNYFIEIEVETLRQAVAVAKFARDEGVPDIILLDNMKPGLVAKCVEAIRREVGNTVLIESSGGVTAKNIGQYIKAGVDVVSSSILTFAAEPLDISMKIIGYK